MKRSLRLLSLLAAVVFCAQLFVLSASATSTTTTTDDGLQVTVEMDKETYEPDEPITATITLKNTKYKEITVNNLEQLIPEGYELAEESKVALKNKTLGAKASVKLTVTMHKAPEESQDGTQKIGTFEPPTLTEVFFGETAGVKHFPFWCVFVIAVLIFYKLT